MVMKSPVTLRDIAEKVGVSKMTVSAVLSEGRNNRVYFSEDTRRRVTEVAQELGYRPNRSARALATGKTHTVALWMMYLHPPYFSRALRHLRDEAMNHHYQMIISGMKGSTEGESGFPEFADSAVDGILAYEGPNFIDRYLDAHQSAHPPLISLGAYYTERTDFVGLDLYPGSCAAVKHLLTTRPAAKQRVAYVVSRWGNHPGDARSDAYLSTMREAGRPPEIIEVPDSSRPAARQTLLAYIAANGCPDAFFCFCDDTALGVYRALCETGRRVPDDAAIIGCDGIEETEFLEKQLSTIVMPADQLCSLGWRFLERRMGEPTLPRQQMILTPKLMLRESS